MADVLSDNALRRIETRLKMWTSGGQYPASWDEVNALCATVRALRTGIRGIRRGHPEWAAAWDELQSQLVQVTQERDVSCWHCGLVLEKQPKPRCEDCPDECDVVNCDAIGCMDKTGPNNI